MAASPHHEASILVPESIARAALGSRACSLRVLAPQYPAIGVGELRLLRVRECGESLELVAGYESYERIPA